MPLLWRSSRESRSERCKRAFLLAPICKVLLAPTLVSDRATRVETHGKQVLYVRGTSLASANQTPSAAFVVPRLSDSDRVRYIRSYRGYPLLVRSRGLKPYLASLTTVTTFGR